MAAHCAGDHAPDRQFVAFENVACRELGIFGKQDNFPTALTQALADGLIVQQCHHHMPVGHPLRFR